MVIIRFRLCSKKIEVNTGIEVLPEHFNIKKGIVITDKKGIATFSIWLLHRSEDKRYKKAYFYMIINETIVINPKKLQNVNAEVVTIPLCNSAKKLIRDENPTKVSGVIFDCLSEQKTNKYLKDIAELARIKKSISMHVAIHTFATLFYERTKDILSLQKILGHSDIKQTLIYSHISEEDKRKGMKLFDIHEHQTGIFERLNIKMPKYL